TEEERRVTLPEFAQTIKETISNRVLPGLIGAMKGKRNANVPMRTLFNHLVIALLPALVFAAAMLLSYEIVTKPAPVQESGLVEMGFAAEFDSSLDSGGLQEPEGSAGLAEPAGAQTVESAADAGDAAGAEADAAADSVPAPASFWITLAVGTVLLIIFYAIFTFARLEVFKMLLSSFFPLAIMILAV